MTFRVAINGYGRIGQIVLIPIPFSKIEGLLLEALRQNRLMK